MKARELRIGNWVMGNKPFQLTINDFGRIHAHLIATGDMRFEPIPLTEEWLLRAGFTHKMYSAPDDDGVYRNKKAPNKDYFTHPNWPDDWTLYLPYFNVNLYSGVCHCQYLHQLQNLYHALTGKELEFISN